MDKMTLLKTFLATSVAGGIALSASAQVLVNEDFESGIGNWTLGAGGSLDTAFGNPGQSGAHDGTGNVTVWNGGGFDVVPTAANPVVLTADLWYSGVSDQYNTVGIRSAGTWNATMFETGFAGTDLGMNGLAVRIYRFADNSNWVQLASFEELGTAGVWIRSEATFTDDSVSVTFDVGADGTVNYSHVAIGTFGYNMGGFNNLRFGGPSGWASPNSGFNVDNISLEVIPEPSTYAAIFGGLALLGAFVYRRRLSAKK